MSTNPKPSARISGGNPTSAPDFKPLNPWGRAMPKFRQLKRQSLYQVSVRDLEEKKAKLIGPKMAQQFAEMFCSEIRNQIAAGNERRWADPVVIPMGEGVY